MKLTLLLPALVLGLIISTSSETLAFGGAPGGPFSNGSYFPNDGTFSAVVRGVNLTGTLQFSTSSNASSTGMASIYFDGDSYLGNSQGANNPADSTMTINFQADSEGQGQNNFELVDTTNGITREYYYFDSLLLTGAAVCTTSNSFPNQKFEGTGVAEFQHLDSSGVTPFEDVESISISITGVRLSDTASFYEPQEVRRPSLIEFTTLLP
jgi:hypothetical protein